MNYSDDSDSSNSTNNGHTSPPVQGESPVPFTASDFAPPYRLTIDGHCVAARLVGASVQYDPDGAGFVFCEVES
jgi:hypothetical protein